jgi:hypothetical protein
MGRPLRGSHVQGACEIMMGCACGTLLAASPQGAKPAKLLSIFLVIGPKHVKVSKSAPVHRKSRPVTNR